MIPRTKNLLSIASYARLTVRSDINYKFYPALIELFGISNDVHIAQASH